MGDLPLPQPNPGEVRVQVKAVSLNPVDYKLAASGHPAWQYPFVLGLDVAGRIDELGEEVEDWKVGDRVFYHGNLSRPGGFAQYTTTVAHVLAHIPPAISFVQAAAVPCAGLTAYQALQRRLHIQEGQTVLVQAGAGGVGGYGIQLAAQAGACVITTASAENHEYVKELGAEAAIDYHHEDVAERVMSWTDGRGVDCVLDTLSSASATAGSKVLAFGGGLACIAGLPDFAQVPFQKAPSIHQISLGGAYFHGGQDAQQDLARMAEEMIAMVAAGDVDAMVTQLLDLEDVPAGLEQLAGRHVRGKIVAVIDD